HLVEIRCNRQNANACRSARPQHRPRRLGRRNVHAACGVVTDQELRFSGKLTREHDALNVASRQRGDACLESWHSQAKTLEGRLDMTPGELPADRQPGWAGVALAFGEDHVLEDRHAWDGTMSKWILRYAGHAQAHHAPGRPTRRPSASDLHRARSAMAQAKDVLAELHLAVAGHRGHTHDLTRV